MSNLLEGKLALVLGIANSWSLAYAIAQAFSKQGAALALTYLGDRQKEAPSKSFRADLNTAAVLPCDVTRDEDLGGAHRIPAGLEPAASRRGAQPGVRQ